MGSEREPTAFGLFVLEQMRKFGYRKQADLARAAGVSDSTVSRWIYSPGRPDPRSLEKLAPAIRMDYSDLLVAAHAAEDGTSTPEATEPAPVVQHRRFTDPRRQELWERLQQPHNLSDAELAVVLSALDTFDQVRSQSVDDNRRVG